MKIFDTKDIRDIDAYTIKHEPVSSIDLMERAASGCADWILQNFSKETHVVIFTGPGNNGGDGWAIARLLAGSSFHHIELYHLQISHVISPDSEINREKLISQGKVQVKYIETVEDFPELKPQVLIIDALFGSGLNRSPEGLPVNLIKHINGSGCRVISIDVPSGLFGENNTGNPDESIVRATDTLTFQFPKRSFFFSENEKYTGNWHIIPIGLHPAVIDKKETPFYYTTIGDLIGKLKKRGKFSHKGSYGHALLIAGSYGMMGAAILAARACMRTGTGLLTSHVPAAGYPVVQAAVPESIFSIDICENIITQFPSLEKYTAVAAGPGIGTTVETAAVLEFLIKECKKPLVIDADGLTILSSHKHLLELLPENTILTPHPGEFDRLAGSSSGGFNRNKLQIELSKKFRIIIILKGAWSSVTMPDGRCYYNSTGNPGMATAGSGDVLTGMILSLLAQGYLPEDAALLGTFMHGMAGDLAAAEKSEQALLASDIIDNIGNVYKRMTRE